MPFLAGTEGLSQWLDDPSYPNSTLAWSIINGKLLDSGKRLHQCLYWSYIDVNYCFFPGTGMITQDIFSSSNYYLALGNLDEEAAAEVICNPILSSIVDLIEILITDWNQLLSLIMIP